MVFACQAESFRRRRRSKLAPTGISGIRYARASGYTRGIGELTSQHLTSISPRETSIGISPRCCSLNAALAALFWRFLRLCALWYVRKPSTLAADTMLKVSLDRKHCLFPGYAAVFNARSASSAMSVLHDQKGQSTKNGATACQGVPDQIAYFAVCTHSPQAMELRC